MRVSDKALFALLSTFKSEVHYANHSQFGKGRRFGHYSYDHVVKKIISENGECFYHQEFISGDECDSLFLELKSELSWRQDPIQIFGKEFLIPRFHCWYGDFDYQYSNITLKKQRMPAVLEKVRQEISDFLKIEFNGVLCNLYRDGQDSNGWHRDNERELIRPIHIASLSLGAERYFGLRRRGETRMDQKVLLENGSLLYMAHPFQDHWEHQIAKTKKITNERINLTFRRG